MTEEKIIICFRCKIKMNKTELKDVYKCPACDLVEEKEQEKWEGKSLSFTTTNEVKTSITYYTNTQKYQS